MSPVVSPSPDLAPSGHDAVLLDASQTNCSTKSGPTSSLLGVPSLVVVFPMYNESGRLGSTLQALAASSLNRTDVQLLFFDDGSTDRSAELVLTLARDLPFVRPIEVSADAQNRGKGSVVRRGTQQAVASGAAYTAFLDADLSLDPSILDSAVERLRAAEADVLVGRRVVDREHQPRVRRLVSLMFTGMTRMIAPTGVSDTQCACKVFTRDAADRIFGQMTTDGFAFDVELLMRARTERMVVIEMDVQWQHTDGSRVNPALEAYRMTRDVIRLRRGISRSAR